MTESATIVNITDWMAKLMTIDLIIPTYKPENSFIEMVDKMENQSVALNHLIIMNTEQKYFERLTYNNRIENKYRDFTIRHLSKKEFDHGRTRNQGVKLSEADYFIMMTQDAMPVDDLLIEKMLKAFKKDPKVAVVYARQVAREDSTEIEKFTRKFNYPDESCVRSKADVDAIGIKAYFCSNVCAMYNRKVFDELGGFLNHAIFNEDMLYAAKAINAGYKVAYAADAEVVHSHNYTNMEYFKRNFDIGVSHAKHPEVFENLNTKGEGMRLVKKTAEHLKKTGNSSKVLGLYITSAYKYLGYRKGLHYSRLSRKALMKNTMNPEYWDFDSIMEARSRIDVHQGYGRSAAEKEMIAHLPNKRTADEKSEG